MSLILPILNPLIIEYVLIHTYYYNKLRLRLLFFNLNKIYFGMNGQLKIF